jgi:hypothetical protein
MNAKTVLKKLVTLLQSNEVELTYAKLKDGTIVESPTFDVGEPLEVVSEDGTKTPAPDGEHELVLRDESGNENIIKVITKDGEIVERENVELADEEIKEAEDIPASKPEDAPIEMEEETYETAPGDIPSTGDGVPADVDQGEIVGADKDIAKQIEELSYRIEELEKKIKMQEEVKEEVVDKEADIEEDMEEEEDLPKLDGAPVEARKFSIMKENNRVVRNLSSQERVLARLYKK